MAIPLFLAMTGCEISKIDELPPNIAWMACHFSPYGTGLTNLPRSLPPNAMVIVNDRTPVYGHDPKRIVSQLTELIDTHHCGSVLLDFQRPDQSETAAIAEAIVRELKCPIGISQPYAENLSCPVFLPPLPLHIPLVDYIAPWQGREIWLECALDGSLITLTGNGCTISSLPDWDESDFPHHDSNLFCRYNIQPGESHVQFHLVRTPADLRALLAAAEGTAVTHAIGLYQELWPML